MRRCRVKGCARATSKGLGQTMCDMHLMRKRRGQPLDAPPRYRVVRKCRKSTLKPGEGKSRLKALLVERPHGVEELCAKLGVSRASVSTWLRELEESGVYVECVTRPARGGKAGARAHLFYVYTGREFHDVEAACL